MASSQGELGLLNDPVAEELLQSSLPAHLAYVWTDGTPRVVPLWFHWNGEEIVFGTPPQSPKVKALTQNPRVAVTIDGYSWPYRVLQVRGTARVKIVEGVVPEYAVAAERYFGPDHGKAWIEQISGMFSQMARVSVSPEWVAILDFEKRFPSAIEAAMST
jgi:PPOX class probable F420-dependent enzyme